MLAIVIAAFLIAGSGAGRPPDGAGSAAATDSTAWQVEALLARSYAGGWNTLPIGERLARFGRRMEGIPYVTGTLEAPGGETCRVTLQGLDCVTFFETCLGLARVMVRPSGAAAPTLEDLESEITFMRYRGGRLTDYTSRLHYTAEWIADNVAKRVADDITPSLGGVRLPVRVDFMSTHPGAYPALAATPGFVPVIRRIERRIGAIPRTYVPRARVAGIEPRLRTGDIIAIATSIRGLDYSHTGVIDRGADGLARLLHASSAQGRVVLDTTIGAYLARGPRSNIGITVVRPRAIRERN
ncbi:MAG: hypothetical protein A2W00_05590 [Candidatus Eisenbacteria bacterium RBG_16_71_46]|nr:MAG: hypothetical protein A2W00_05590 [Candidatus Eisenbacteria bacterium RBG_16_71_46]OGF25474.1 MAG: hypothetical protein A2V63_00370 [Candidatus Eisenbacteria bacterium RBG_19FT_COMBO_70_11]